MPIEYTRQEPPDERECFTCAFCDDDFDLTGLEVVINKKTICDICAEEVSDQLGHYERMLKAERENKFLRKELNNLPCDCNAQHAHMTNIAHSEFCPRGIGEYVLYSIKARLAPAGK